jgi:hypothetical protein
MHTKKVKKRRNDTNMYITRRIKLIKEILSPYHYEMLNYATHK